MSQNSCSVPGCQVTRGDGIPLHRFPNPVKNGKKFKTWIFNIGGDVMTLDSLDIYNNKRVCHKHFEDFYKYPKNRLNKLAIPVLYMPVSAEETFLQDKTETSISPTVPHFHRQVADNVDVC